jgi:hypothetical protein
MKLTNLGVVIELPKPIRFVGKAVLSALNASDGEPYYVWPLKYPVLVGCSTNRNIQADEYTELHIRQSSLELDIWEKDEDGYFIPGWVADFSTGQLTAIYQDTTIAKWSRENRTARNAEKDRGINERIEARKAKMAEERAAAAKAGK